MILDEELKRELDRINEEETQNQLLENMSEDEFQKFFDKFFIPYEKAFRELA